VIDPTETLLIVVMGTGVNRATAEQLIAEHDAIVRARELRLAADEMERRAAVIPDFRVSKDAVLRFLRDRAREIREQATPAGVADAPNAGGDAR